MLAFCNPELIIHLLVFNGLPPRQLRNFPNLTLNHNGFVRFVAYAWVSHLILPPLFTLFTFPTLQID